MRPKTWLMIGISIAIAAALVFLTWQYYVSNDGNYISVHNFNENINTYDNGTIITVRGTITTLSVFGTGGGQGNSGLVISVELDGTTWFKLNGNTPPEKGDRISLTLLWFEAWWVDSESGEYPITQSWEYA
jgi:hypothetical protein